MRAFLLREDLILLNIWKDRGNTAVIRFVPRVGIALFESADVDVPNQTSIRIHRTTTECTIVVLGKPRHTNHLRVFLYDPLSIHVHGQIVRSTIVMEINQVRTNLLQFHFIDFNKGIQCPNDCSRDQNQTHNDSDLFHVSSSRRIYSNYHIIAYFSYFVNRGGVMLKLG